MSFILACFLAVAASPGADPSVKSGIDRARDAVYPALVNISVVRDDYDRGRLSKQRAVGSGVLLTRDGCVVTNYHVTSGARKITCTLWNQEEVEAELVGEDPLTDLAVVRLKRPGKEPLPFAVLGNSDSVAVGDYVLAMGSPWALARSVTLGIVANRARVFYSNAGDGEMELERNQQTGLFTRWIQHDASISPGNSGGPLVNLRGEVIGINELANMIGGDMGFAIPSNLVREVMDEIIREGEVRRSWIGIGCQPTNKTGFTEGVLVSSVVEKSPAAKAGLKPGDLILSIDGRPVSVKFPDHLPDFYKTLADAKRGRALSFRIQRDSVTTEVKVKPEPLRKYLGDEAELKAWGLTLEDLTGPRTQEMKLDRSSGVIVTEVRPGGAAAKARPALAGGDIIRSVDDSPVENLAALLSVQSRRKDGKLLLEVERDRSRFLSVIKPEAPEELTDNPREIAKAWVGVEVQALTPDLSQIISPDGRDGVRVIRVYEGTNAAVSKLKIGDIISSINGAAIRARSDFEAGIFASMIGRLKIGSKVKLGIFRDCDPDEASMVLETAPLRVEDAARLRVADFDLSVRDITFYDRKSEKWGKDVTGVLVESVEPGGWAGLAHLWNGDLIERVDGRRIRDVRDFRAALRRVKAKRSARVVLLVRRESRTRFLFVEPDWDEGRSGGR